jgi:hypothetical protein
MKRLALPAVMLLTMIFASAGEATTLFQLKGNAAVEAVDEALSFSLTVGGITATLTANVGVLNTTLSGFGINHPTTGDPTDHIDGMFAVEAVSIVFNLPVQLDQIVLSDSTGGTTGDLASLTIDGFGLLTLIPTAPALAVYNFSSNNTVPVGQSILLAWQTGNGFSFDSFSVTVPEPATGLLLCVGLLLVLRVRNRSQREGRPRHSCALPPPPISNPSQSWGWILPLQDAS